MPLCCLISTLEDDVSLFLEERGWDRPFECMSLEELQLKVEEISLFSDERPLFLRLEAIQESESLQLFVKQPKNVLIQAKKGEAKKGFQGEWIDLTREKPWERKKRFLSHYQKYLHTLKKQTEPDLLELLYQKVDGQTGRFREEFFKLLTYIDQHDLIRKVDLDQLNIQDKELSDWEIAEEIVYKHIYKPLAQTTDFPLLLSKLRQEAYFALEILSNSSVTLPVWKQKRKERLLPTIQRLSEGYFLYLLKILFEIELDLKSTILSEKQLYDRLFFQLSR